MRRKNRTLHILFFVSSLSLMISPFSPLVKVLAAAVQPAGVSFTCLDSENPVKIMPTGDSITRGSQSTNVNGYRRPLYLALTNDPYDYSIDFVGSQASGVEDGSFDRNHEGRSGWHADHTDPTQIVDTIADNINTWLIAQDPDIVLLHIGTNDISAGEASASEVGVILDKIKAYNAGIHTIVALIINRVPTSATTTSYNNDVRDLVEARQASGDNVSWVDMESALDYATDMADAVHPDDSGYAKMAEVWEPAVASLCSGSPWVYQPADQTGAEGENIFLQVTAHDPNGQELTYGATNLPQGLSIDTGTGLISGTISYEAYTDTPYTVLVSATDPDENTDTKSFQWNINDTNRAPVLETLDPLPTTAEGASVSLQIEANDPDGDSFSFAMTGLPPGLSYDPDTGVITGTLSYEAYNGDAYLVAVTVADEGEPVESSQMDFYWTIAPTNRPPVVNPINDRSNPEGTNVSLQAKASDPDGDSWTFSAQGLPDGLAIDPVSGQVSGKVSYAASGTHTVTIFANDNGSPIAESGSTTFQWTIANVNRPPVITRPADQTAAKGQVVSLPVVASDPDSDTLTFSATGLPPGLQISEYGLISGKISKDTAGSLYTVAVTVVDPGGMKDEQTFTWTISGVAPPANPVYLPLVIK